MQPLPSAHGETEVQRAEVICDLLKDVPTDLEPRAASGGPPTLATGQRGWVFLVALGRGHVKTMPEEVGDSPTCWGPPSTPSRG